MNSKFPVKKFYHRAKVFGIIILILLIIALCKAIFAL